MSKTPAPARRLSPADVYELAGELVRFRYLIEIEYASADVACDTHAEVPEAVEHAYGSIAVTAERMKRQGGDAAALEGPVTEAKSILERFRADWMGAEHRNRRDSRAEMERGLEDGPRFRLDWLMLTCPLAYRVTKLPHPFGGPDNPFFTRLAFTPSFDSNDTGRVSTRSGSPFGPVGWQAYEAARHAFCEILSESERSIFVLGRRLAEWLFPIPTSFDEKTGCPLVLDTDHLARGVVPEIAEAVRSVQQSSGLLTGIEPHLKGPDIRPAAIRMDAAIRGALPGTPATIPRWNKRTGALFYGEEQQRIARFSNGATSARRWLDLFEKLGWPGSVTDQKCKSEVRRQAYRTLNGKQQHLEFFPIDDPPKGMGYRPLPVANPKVDT